MPDFLLPILFFLVFILILAESIYFLNKHNQEITGTENPSEIKQPKRTPLLRIILPILILVVIGGLVLFFWKRGGAEKTVSTVLPSPTLFLRPTATPIPIAQNIISPTILPTTNITPTLSQIITPTKTPVPTKTPIPTKTPTPTRTPTPTKSDQTTEERIGEPIITSSETVIQPKMPVAGRVDQTLLFLGTGIITLLLGIVL